MISIAPQRVVVGGVSDSVIHFWCPPLHIKISGEHTSSCKSPSQTLFVIHIFFIITGYSIHESITSQILTLQIPKEKSFEETFYFKKLRPNFVVSIPSSFVLPNDFAYFHIMCISKMYQLIRITKWEFWLCFSKVTI